jgi:hypothetical protein
MVLSVLVAAVLVFPAASVTVPTGTVRTSVAAQGG